MYNLLWWLSFPVFFIFECFSQQNSERNWLFLLYLIIHLYLLWKRPFLWDTSWTILRTYHSFTWILSWKKITILFHPMSTKLIQFRCHPNSFVIIEPSKGIDHFLSRTQPSKNSHSQIITEYKAYDFGVKSGTTGFPHREGQMFPMAN